MALLDLGVQQLVQRAVIHPISLGPLDIIRSYNEGLLMGLGADLGPGTILIGTALITGAVAIIALRGCPPLPSGLLLGGALGNVFDRVPRRPRHRPPQGGRITRVQPRRRQHRPRLRIMLFAASTADDQADHGEHRS